MSEKNHVPAIRFAGFTDAWEQRKVGDIITSEVRPITMEDDSLYQLLTVKRRNEGVVSRGWFKGRDILVKNYFRVRSGDFVISKRQIIHGANGMVPESLDNAIVSNEYLVCVSNESITTEYLTLYSQLPEMYKMYFLSSYGVDVEKMVFNVEDWYKRQLFLPSIEEQKQLTRFFSHIDHLITLHQRKYDQLVKVKRAMLEKMFPKGDARVPEIRFAGFTDAWEQRKVGDFYDFKNGLNKGKEYFGYGTPIVNFTDVFHNRGIFASMLRGRVTLELSEVRNFEVRKGDIFFTRTSETIEEIGYPAVMLDDPQHTVFSGFVLRGRSILEDDPLDNLFKKYVFFTDSFRKEMTSKSSMTTRALTSGTSLRHMTFQYPPAKEEQYRIGEFLTRLDTLITLHQRQLEKLKKIKASMLEKMFV